MLTLIVLAIIWSLYHGAFSKLNKKNTSQAVITITKVYMVVVAIIVSIYMLSFNIVSIKMVMLGIYSSFISYLFIFDYLDKKMCSFKKIVRPEAYIYYF